MNGEKIRNAIVSWLDDRDLAYVLSRDTRFSFTLEGLHRVAFFNATFDIDREAILGDFAFPVCPFEDETLDTRAAIDRMNAALAMGSVYEIPEGRLLFWCAGFRAADVQNVPAAINAMVEYGRNVIDRYTDCLTDMLINGRASGSDFPSIPCPLSEEFEPLPGASVIERLQARQKKAEEEALSEEEPDKDRSFIQRRMEETSLSADASYLAYREMLKCRPLSGNSANRLRWYQWNFSRIDQLRFDLRTARDTQSITATFPIIPAEGEQRRLQDLLDEINEKLQYGSMFLMRGSRTICYRLSVYEIRGDMWQESQPFFETTQFFIECSEVFVRCMYDMDADLELLVALCEEGIAVLNERCRQGGLREVMQ